MECAEEGWLLGGHSIDRGDPDETRQETSLDVSVPCMSFGPTEIREKGNGKATNIWLSTIRYLMSSTSQTSEMKIYIPILLESQQQGGQRSLSGKSG